MRRTSPATDTMIFEAHRISSCASFRLVFATSGIVKSSGFRKLARCRPASPSKVDRADEAALRCRKQTETSKMVVKKSGLKKVRREEWQVQLEKLADENPLILHTDAGRTFSMARRMKAEEKMGIPISLRSGFAISTENGKAANAMMKMSGTSSTMLCLNISGAIIRTCTRACFRPITSAEEGISRSCTLTRFTRELRAGSIAVSLFSSNHTDPPAWPNTIRFAKKTGAEGLMLLGFKRARCVMDDRMPPAQTINSGKL